MKTFVTCFIILGSSALVLYDEMSVVLRAFVLITLLMLVWLDGAVRERNQCVKFLKELNAEVKKCQTSLKP